MVEQELGKDRRKNVARHKADITYEVVWNDERTAFEIYRDGQRTQAFAKDQAGAIDLAIKLAQHDHDRGLDALVFAVRDGNKNMEWAGAKMPKLVPKP